MKSISGNLTSMALNIRSVLTELVHKPLTTPVGGRTGRPRTLYGACLRGMKAGQRRWYYARVPGGKAPYCAADAEIQDEQDGDSAEKGVEERVWLH